MKVIQQNLLYGIYKKSIIRKAPYTLEELLDKVKKYIQIGEAPDIFSICKRKNRKEEHRTEQREDNWRNNIRFDRILTITIFLIQNSPKF